MRRTASLFSILSLDALSPEMEALPASVRSRSMSAMVNDALDEALPSLEEIRLQLTLPAAEAAAAGILPDLHLGPDGLVMLTHDGPAVSPVPDEGTGNGSGC